MDEKKEDAPQDDTARNTVDTEEPNGAFPVGGCIPFQVKYRRDVAYGSKRAELSIETPIGVLELDLFAPEGRSPFVAPRSIRNKYSGQWSRTFTLDTNFARAVLERLAGGDSVPERPPPTPSPKPPAKSAAAAKSAASEDWATDQERRFEQAARDGVA